VQLTTKLKTEIKSIAKKEMFTLTYIRNLIAACLKISSTNASAKRISAIREGAVKTMCNGLKRVVIDGSINK